MTEQRTTKLVGDGLHVGMLGTQMQRRTLMGAIVGIFGLAGCGSSGQKQTDEEWNQLLIDALEPIEHVAELTKFSYSMQGVLGANNSAWIFGTVHSDSDDVATNEALLDEVGRTIATVHRNNPTKRSRISVSVLSPSDVSYEFWDKVDHPVVTIDDLAKLYGVDR